MNEVIKNDLMTFAPEISLVCFALLAQVIGLSKKFEKLSAWVAIMGMVSTIFLLFYLYNIIHSDTLNTLNNQGFRSSLDSIGNALKLSNFLNLGNKIFVFIFGLAVIISYIGYAKKVANLKSEYLSLLMLTLVGAGLSVSADNLLVLFVGLELQALIGYLLAAFDRDRAESSEAGLKYFILGGVASCIILLGMSFLYGFSGSISYSDISKHANSAGVIAGIILLFCGFMFKLSAAPFHMWTPDVYEGAPMPSVVLFSSVQKVAIVCVLMSGLGLLFSGQEVGLLAKVFIVFSLIIGSVGGLMQESVKRLMAYSTIMNMGFVLMPFVHRDEMGLVPLIYASIYAASTIGFFTLLIIAVGGKADSATLNDLCGFARSNKAYGAMASVFVFSLIGLPPFAGFFGKYYVIYNAVMHEEYLLAVTAILSSVIAAFYYLKIIRFMYFEDQGKMGRVKSNFYLSSVVWVSLIFIILLGFKL